MPKKLSDPEDRKTSVSVSMRNVRAASKAGLDVDDYIESLQTALQKKQDQYDAMVKEQAAEGARAKL